MAFLQDSSGPRTVQISPGKNLRLRIPLSRGDISPGDTPQMVWRWAEAGLTFWTYLKEPTFFTINTQACLAVLVGSYHLSWWSPRLCLTKREEKEGESSAILWASRAGV